MVGSGSPRRLPQRVYASPPHTFAHLALPAIILGILQLVLQGATDSLNPCFTAVQAIADPLRRLADLCGLGVHGRIAERAPLVSLPHELLLRYPHQLSSRQKVRVGIARALASNPQLLLLGEPTSTLDVSVQAVILKLLDDLRRRLGMSFLFVSRDLIVVRLMCERVYVTCLGRIIEEGPGDRSSSTLGPKPRLSTTAAVGNAGRDQRQHHLATAFHARADLPLGATGHQPDG